MLHDLGTFFLHDLVYQLKENQQRAKIENLKDWLTVGTDALYEDLTYLCEVLRYTCFTLTSVHTLQDGVYAPHYFTLHYVLCIESHTLFLLPHIFEKDGNTLNLCFVV